MRPPHPLSIAVLSASLALGVVPGHGAEPARPAPESIGPTPPTLASTESRTRVTQYGITWTFEQARPVGQFVTGDYFVIGPARIVSIDPKPLVGQDVPAAEIDPREKARIRDGRFLRNGSMLNPPARSEVAFDSGIRNYFRPAHLAQAPLDLKAGDCLISTISMKAGEKADFPYHAPSTERGVGDNSPVRTAAVLTCLDAVPPADAFRPSYGDRERTLYRASTLRRELLPKLPAPPETPDLATWIRIFERPWINPCFFGFEQPLENMPHYGQWVGQAQSMAGLLLVLDLDARQKERFVNHLVQVGIDYWGLVKNGHPGWQGWGGHGSGRKFPIVVAGWLLGDARMASPTRAFPRVEFGEDNQTAHAPCWTGAQVVFAGHSGIQRASGKSERPHWGPYEHLHPSLWKKEQCQSEEYRRANTSSSWVGQALALRLLKAEDAWAHPAFFDYVDRWMLEPNDRDHRQVIMKHQPQMRLDDKARFTHQGQTWEPFVKAMWSRYRGLGAPPAQDAPPPAARNQPD